MDNVTAAPVAKKTVTSKLVAKAPPKPAVKKAPVVAKKAVKPKRKSVASKTYAYRLGDGPISAPYADQKAMLDDISLQAGKDDVIVIYRESRRGSIKTKVRIA